MKKILNFILGLLIMTLGTVVMIDADIGVAAYDALCVGIANNVGISTGNVCMIMGITIVCINAIIQKRIPSFFSWLTSIIVGIGIDFWMKIVVLNTCAWYRYFIFVFGMIISSFGIALYVTAGLAKGPIDQLMLNISTVLKKSTWVGKTIMEASFLLIVFIIKGPIGWGTIIVTFMSGFFIDRFISYLERRTVNERQRSN